MYLIAVLGCGPTGLVAAHAAIQDGHSVAIFSKNRKSHMYGAQYLHRPIPGITEWDAEQTINYTLVGSANGYRAKVYPGQDVGMVSPEKFNGKYPAWDIRAAYTKLWKMYHGLIRESGHIDSDWIEGSWLDPYDFVISTIPRIGLCEKPEQHTFDSRKIWAMGDSPKQRVEVECPTNTIICNGSFRDPWYRTSNVFGWRTVEWAGGSRPKPLAAELLKPIRTDCTCHDDVEYVGRYGAWRKSILVHQAYDEVRKIISQ